MNKPQAQKIPISDDSINLAIKNIAEFGDTDIFPYPLENLWFKDQPGVVASQLFELRDLGMEVFHAFPIFSTTELCNVGFAGFRAATQIDPLWNAIFLAAVIEIAPQIELRRCSPNQVFSYRFQPDSSSGSLFAKHGWREYQTSCLDLAKEYGCVASVDISDFYSRIYHHRLENTLRTDCGCEHSLVKFIDKFLSRINVERSFGLPVGGPASRILAEALLVRTDRLLATSRTPFIRFVDDYYLFGKTEEDVRISLLSLNKLLLDNEGLSLNRSKTRILSSSELQEQSIFNTGERRETVDESVKRRFFSLRLQYDPYSPTADQDYKSLSEQIEQFDVLNLIENEVRKTRLDRFAVNQLVKAVRFIKEPDRSSAVATLARNIETLAPVFPVIAITFRHVMDDITTESRELFLYHTRRLVENRSPLIGASGTLAYAVRLLAHDPNPESDSALDSVFYSPDVTPILQREVVLAMIKRKSTYWLSNLRNRIATITNPWVRRSMLLGSFVLKDEGEHWRKAEKKLLSDADKAFLAWLSSKHCGSEWEVTL